MNAIKQILEKRKMKGADPCWNGYEMVGTKDKDGKKVPNCVPEEVLYKEDLDEQMSALNEMPGANMDTRAVHQHLKKSGWSLTRTSGGHDVYTHPSAKHNIAVPRHKQLKAPLVLGILKASRIKEEVQTIGEEEEVSSLKDIVTSSDYKTDKRGRKHRAHKLIFNKGEEENMKEELVGNQHKLDINKNNKIDSEDLSTLRKLKAKMKKEQTELDEAEMSADQMKERERIVKGMKKSYKDFVSKYGQERAKSVMYATATKMAMKEEVEELDEAFKPGDKVKYETSKYSKDNVGTVVSHKGDKVVVNHKDYLGANQELELHHSMVRMHDAPAKSDVVSNRHKVAVTVSEPDHPSVSQRKVKQQKFVKLTADDKNSAVEKAKKFYSGKGFKVHDAEYHSAINEEVSLDESDSIPSVYQKRDAAGTYHIEYSGKDKDGTTEKKLYKVKANDHHHAQFKVLKIGASDFPHHVQASSVTHKFIKEESINENNFAFHVQKAEDAKSRGDDVAFKHHMRIAGVKHSAMSDREKSETPKNVTLFQKLKEEVELDEAVDKEHPIVKEYDSLKKNSIATLRNLIKGQHRIVDTSEYKTKDHTISAYLRNKHGDKRVDQAFGFKEEVELDEAIKPYISGDHKGGWSILDSKGKEVKRFHHSDYDDHPIADKKTAAKNDAVRYLKKHFDKLSEEVEALDEMTQGKEYTSKQLMDKVKSGNWEATTDIKPGKTIEMRHQSGKKVMVKCKHDMN